MADAVEKSIDFFFDFVQDELEQISIKRDTMAVGDNVGAGLVPAQ
jgi:hypothetical protein